MASTYGAAFLHIYDVMVDTVERKPVELLPDVLDALASLAPASAWLLGQALRPRRFVLFVYGWRRASHDQRSARCASTHAWLQKPKSQCGQSTR